MFIRSFTYISIAGTAHSGCTVNGQKGTGRKRGTCDENRNCYPDGTCIQQCTVNGAAGDSTSRGTCEENHLCEQNGYCFGKLQLG